MPLLYSRLRRKHGPADSGISRREMLRHSLAAAAGLLISELRELPAQAIDAVDNDAVFLNITRDAFQAAPGEPDVLLF